jgi:hypothetical protein
MSHRYEEHPKHYELHIRTASLSLLVRSTNTVLLLDLTQQQLQLQPLVHHRVMHNSNGYQHGVTFNHRF